VYHTFFANRWQVEHEVLPDDGAVVLVCLLFAKKYDTPFAYRLSLLFPEK
jgi:hypothetical protein